MSNKLTTTQVHHIRSHGDALTNLLFDQLVATEVERDTLAALVREFLNQPETIMQHGRIACRFCGAYATGEFREIGHDPYCLILRARQALAAMEVKE